MMRKSLVPALVAASFFLGSFLAQTAKSAAVTVPDSYAALMAALARNDPPNALAIVGGEVTSGKSWAMYAVARMNATGWMHGTKNPAAAHFFFLRSAQAGYAPAMKELSRIYANGTGVPKDMAKSQFWARKAEAAAADFIPPIMVREPVIAKNAAELRRANLNTLDPASLRIKSSPGLTVLHQIGAEIILFGPGSSGNPYDVVYQTAVSFEEVRDLPGSPDVVVSESRVRRLIQRMIINGQMVADLDTAQPDFAAAAKRVPELAVVAAALAAKARVEYNLDGSMKDYRVEGIPEEFKQAVEMDAEKRMTNATLRLPAKLQDIAAPWTVRGIAQPLFDGKKLVWDIEYRILEVDNANSGQLAIIGIQGLPPKVRDVLGGADKPEIKAQTLQGFQLFSVKLGQLVGGESYLTLVMKIPGQKDEIEMHARIFLLAIPQR